MMKMKLLLIKYNRDSLDNLNMNPLYNKNKM